MLDMYLNILLICASHEESENFTCCRVFPPLYLPTINLTTPKVLWMKKFFPLE